MSPTLVILTGVFQTVLSASLHVALLIVMVLVVQRLFRRQISSQCRYLLWLLVVGRLLFPMVPQSSLSLLGLFQWSGQSNVFHANTSPHVARNDETAGASVVPDQNKLPATDSVAGETSQPFIASEPPSLFTPPTIDAQNVPANSPVGLIDTGSLVWLLGFVLLVGRDCVMHFRTSRFINALEYTPDPRLAALFDECKCELGVTRNVQLLTCDRLIPPGIFGVFWPRVIVPRRLSLVMSDEELRFLFLHELIHFQRNDVPVALVTSVLRCMHWFNPLVWYAERRMTEDRELACDTAVLRRITPAQYQSYAETVVKVLEQLLTAKPAFGTVSMAYGKASMKRRLSMLSSFQEPTWRQFVVGVLLLITLTVTGLTRPSVADTKLKAEKSEQENATPPRQAGIRFGSDTLRHDGDAKFLDFSPDGNWIACSSRAEHVFIFDAATGKPLRRIEVGEHARRVCGLQFSPVDGSLVVGSQDKIYFYSPASGELLRTLPISFEDRVQLGFDWKFDISADGEQIVLLPAEFGQTCIVLDVNAGKEIARFERQLDWSYQANFSPDGKSLAFASLDPGAKVWDIASGKLEYTLPGHDHSPGGAVKQYAMTLGYSPDGKTLATGASKEIFLWDVETKQLRQKLLVSRNKNLFISIAFTPDSKTVVGGSQDGNVYVWNAETGKLRYELSSMGSLKCVAISADGTKLAASCWHNRLLVWDLQTGKPLFPNPTGHRYSVKAVTFTPDGNQIVSSSGSRQILFWDAQSGELVRPINTKDRSHSLHFLSDGKRLISGGHGREGITVWDSETGERIRRFGQIGLPRNNHFMRAFQLSTDEKRLVVAGFDSDRFTLQFSSWDFENHRRSLKFIEGDIRAAPAIAIHPDCNLAAIGYGDEILIWDLRSGEQIAELKGHKHNVKSLAFSPDGERLVTGSLDGTVRVWNRNTFEQIQIFSAEQPIAVVSYSPDGQVIAAGGGYRGRPARSANRSQVIFWDASSGNKIGHVSGQRANVTALGFSADGDRIASGHEDGYLFVWQVPTTEN